MGVFAEYLLRSEHLLVMVAVSASMSLAAKIMPSLNVNPYWVRLLPVIPVLACSAAVWLPGLLDGTVGERLLLGVVLGSLCGHAHKLVLQSIFGNDVRIRDRPRPRI